MSVFDVGMNGTLVSTNLPAAFVEASILLNQREINRNAANPGIPPQQRVTAVADFDAKTFTITASLPVAFSVNNTSGKVELNGVDYLGSTYNAFNNGGGDLISDNLVDAYLELSQILSSAENAVDLATRPANITLAYDPENGLANITAAIPFVDTLSTTGAVTVTAQDYL